MFYNIILDFKGVLYPRIYTIIPQSELLKLIQVYENKKESAFINGEEIYIKEPSRFKIYDTSKVNPNTAGEIQRRIDEYLFIQTLGELPVDSLTIFGIDVTNNFIFGAWGDKKQELFNFYIKTKIDGKDKILIKHALNEKNIETLLQAIKLGETQVFIDGKTIYLNDPETIKIFDVSKTKNKNDKGALKNEMNQLSGIFNVKGLDLLKQAGLEVTHKFNVEKPLKVTRVENDKTLTLKESNNMLKKIFISHASKDAKKISPFRDLINIIGLSDNQIFYSSDPVNGVSLGENIFERLKKELSGDIFAIFMLSDNFYKSHVCLCEMGAVWIKSNKQIPVLLPPFSFGDVKGVFPNSLGFKVNHKEQLNNFKIELETYFELKPIHPSRWEEKRDKFITDINTIIEEEDIERKVKIITEKINLTVDKRISKVDLSSILNKEPEEKFTIGGLKLKTVYMRKDYFQIDE